MPIIVCVDDDVQVASTLARSLRREKYNSLTTTEPDEALEWVLEHDVAVLIADFAMPVMTGIELAERVRVMRPSTVRILLTAHLSTDTAVAGINQAEIYRFVAKPFDLEVLMSTVRQGVARHREIAAVAAEREHAARRAAVTADLEAAYPDLTKPARAHDGAYLVQRPSTGAIERAGLGQLAALRGK